MTTTANAKEQRIRNVTKCCNDRISNTILLLLILYSSSSEAIISWKWGDSNKRGSRRSNKSYYDRSDEDYQQNEISGLGKEFNLFPRGGISSSTFPPGTTSGLEGSSSSRTYYKKRRRTPPPSSSSSSPSKPNGFESFSNWIRENQSSIPRIQVRVEPNTTLKLRKRFRPLFKTVATLGADFNTQLGVWQFKSSWEDNIIGGRLTLAGRELQLSKTWLLSVGAVEDLVTRLRLRAAIDLGTGKAYARLGFRTERLSPINVVEGFTLLRQLPLDGTDGHIKLEVKANFAFPEPEIEYSTEKRSRSIVGMGDIEINIDELNLLLDY